ncbi:hypothetical protein GUITHDRAFT_158976 [Guillardia theta CCMP2712]|uniref:4-hydroxyphenylpyruvate dioxygenase n=2 Tax=Guillardia theta TaxID=55529 RepID=L1I9H9_GUITC|nr:hypothetical protein GUITHDRAFT_158976 [Guillardia theta CCMP2712]EKX32564.1 hypothetical protein GUITHDRAFT_158976 [Guillardia theta CCMP2712]|eukprot:XP_005819544.1 hypothetical protein GUITHDRAFT_158976 [Guillardia theta CCMP2712]
MYDGFHHVEMWVGNAKQAACYFMARFGFREVAYRGLETGSRDVATHVVEQGTIRFAFSSALTPGNEIMSQHHSRHGDGVRDVAFVVKDCRAAYEEIMRRGGRSIAEPREISDEHGSAIVATIATYGDTVHTLVEKRGYNGPFLPGFRQVSTVDPLTEFTASPKLEFIDHVVGNQPDDAMEAVCEWYSDVMGFRRFWSVDDKQVTTEYSSLRSVVMTDEEESIKMPINEPAQGLRKSQIQEFVEYYDGPGVQHIALRTFDVIHTVKTLKQRGVEFLKVPSAYYDDLERRLKEAGVTIKEDLSVIRNLNILVDFDETGYLLQIFMRPIQDRPTLFLEIIQRQKHEGFGVGNFKALFEAIEREQELRGNL